jgi:multiple sugar transport system ATP-binding protein
VSGDRAKKLAAYNGKTVVLGIRPQDMVEKSFSGSIVHPSDTVRMQVDVIETMGAVKTLYLTVGKSSLVAEVDAESPAKELAPIDVVFDLDTVHAFDPSTEQAIF